MSSLVDFAGIEAASERLAAVRARHADAVRARDEADAAVVAARRLLPEAIERAADGREPLTPEAIEHAHAEVRRAVAWSNALTSVHERVRVRQQDAEERLADAKAAGWARVLAEGAALRVRAGRMLDRARLEAPSGTTQTDMLARREFLSARADEARAVYDEGTRLANLGVANGARMPAGRGWLPEWPPTEAAEAKHWAGVLPHAEGEADAA